MKRYKISPVFGPSFRTVNILASTLHVQTMSSSWPFELPKEVLLDTKEVDGFDETLSERPAGGKIEVKLLFWFPKLSGLLEFEVCGKV